MIQLRIDFQDKRLRRMMERAPGEIRRAIMTGLRVIANGVADRAKTLAPGRFGALRASIGVKLDEQNLTAYVGSLLQAKATGSKLDPKGYAYFVEHGRAPGAPPPASSLQLWAKRYSHGEFDENRTAFLIAKSIGQKGTRPQPFLTPALAEVAPKAQDLMDRVLAKTLDDLEKRS